MYMPSQKSALFFNGLPLTRQLLGCFDLRRTHRLLERIEVRGSMRIASTCGYAELLVRLCKISLNAITFDVHHAKVHLGMGIPSLCGSLVVLYGFAIILWYSPSFGVLLAKVCAGIGFP